MQHLYKIFHVTRFAYSGPITETQMEIRMEPRSDERQRCRNFALQITPKAKTLVRYDHHANKIHTFDIPGEHSSIEIKAESIVEIFEPHSIPDHCDSAKWDELDAIKFHPSFWEFTNPSEFARPGEGFDAFLKMFAVGREVDPLEFIKRLNGWMYETLSYDPEATAVDSPIEVAIRDRRGVCQDFSNIMITVLRSFGVPARYVSGYLFHRTDDRSHVAQDSTHAWIEAYIPGCGWLGFDPTNNTTAGERHLRVAIGRDYADVPPTRGVFKGVVESTLSVAVRVSLADESDAGLSPPAFVKRILAAAPEKKHVYRHDDQQQ